MLGINMVSVFWREFGIGIFIEIVMFLVSDDMWMVVIMMFLSEINIEYYIEVEVNFGKIFIRFIVVLEGYWMINLEFLFIEDWVEKNIFGFYFNFINDKVNFNLN